MRRIESVDRSRLADGGREGIESLEPGEQQSRIRDAEDRDRRVHDVAYGTLAPPQHRIVQADREEDHPRDDAEAEDRDAEEDATEGRHAQRDDEEDEELIVAR